MAEPRSALAGLAQGGNHAGTAVSERTGLGLLTLRGPAGDPAFAKAVADTFGAALPQAANTAVQASGGTLLWLSPDAWLAVTADAAQAAKLAQSVEAAGGHALDTSHARVAIRLEGEGVRMTLAQGCCLDLHPRAFAVDACAQTLLARVSVLLHRSAAETFDLYVPRSYARGVWSWLMEL